MSAAASDLSRDEQRLALWEAIRAIEIGNRDDDKLIVANLHKAGYVIAAHSAASSPTALDHFIADVEASGEGK